MLLKGLSFWWLETDSTQSFSLDLTSLGNPGPASVPHPRSQAGTFLVALWGFKSMPSPPGEDGVGSKEKPGSCPAGSQSPLPRSLSPRAGGASALRWRR